MTDRLTRDDVARTLNMNEASCNELVVREAESARAALAAFIRNLDAEEFDWRPDDGIPSARDWVGSVIADESRRREAFGGTRRKAGRGAGVPTSPAACADLLRSERAATLEALQGKAASSTMLALLLADTRAMTGVVGLQRLIDPSRVLPV